MASDCYALAERAVAAATADSARRIVQATRSDEVVDRGLLDREWQRLIQAHRDLCVTFDYLDAHMTKREGLTSIPKMCADARDGCPVWARARETWTPTMPLTDSEVSPEQPVLLIFSKDETLSVSAGALTGCETMLKQISAAQPHRGETVRLVMKSSRAAMMKLMEYTGTLKQLRDSGATAEEQRAFVLSYKKSMEPQDQLPLLFQTLTAANHAGCNALLDELCQLVAEMMAQRTPQQIQEYFNIKNDCTWEEEQELIATHKWIDPEVCVCVRARVLVAFSPLLLFSSYNTERSS